ncbi:hypothetical protein KXW88_008590, partial [Aspergillus fumigatus]
MAFQVPVSRPNLAAVTSDLWPSMSKLLNAPWASIQHTATSASPSTRQLHQRTLGGNESSGTGPIPLPECLDTVPLEALNSNVMQRPVKLGLSRTFLG